MKNIQVAVAEHDARLLEELRYVIGNDGELNIVGTAGDGKEACKLLEENEIDVMVMELLLPYIDGFGVLDKYSKKSKKPKVIMTTSLYNNAIVKESFKKGVDYFVVKPYEVDTITTRIKQIAEQDDVLESGNYGYDLNSLIAKNLIQIGVPASLKGYKYVATAIKKATENQEVLEGVTKILYPEIAKMYDSTPQRVEKAIRHAIEVAWNRNSESELKKKFSVALDKGKVRPTNSEFIAVMSEYIRNSYR